MFKVANFHLAPYGLEVVYGNSYTQNRDHQRDLLILESQIFIDNKEINLSDKYGTFQTNARDVIKNIALSREEYITYCKGFPSKRTFVEKLGLEFAIISAFSALFAILLVIARLSDPGFYQAISIVVVIVSVLVGIFLILMLVVDLMTTINISKAMKLYKARLIPLTTYYPMQVDEKYALMSRSVLN